MTLPYSLYGLATELRNLMRGGKSVDDDSVSIRQLAKAIVDETAAVMQEEMLIADNRGDEVNPEFFRSGHAQFGIPREQPTELPVLVRTVCLPKSLVWKGEPAVRDMRASVDGRSFVYCRYEPAGVITALGEKYVPGGPSYVLTGDSAVAYLPMGMGLIPGVKFKYVPADLSVKHNGDPLDPDTEEFPVPKYLWPKVKARIMGTDANTLLQTKQNRDRVNDGADN